MNSAKRTPAPNFSSGSTLFVKVKRIFRQQIQYFVKKLDSDTPRYVQLIIPSLLYQTRRRKQLVYKGLSLNVCFISKQMIKHRTGSDKQNFCG